MQYVEEVTYGTTPTSPTFVHPGPLIDFKENYTTADFAYRQVGSRDIYAMIKSGELYSFDVKFSPVSAAFMNYGINLPNGAGTIERGLSVLFSQKINGVEYFVLYTGCKCDKVDVEITEKLVSVSMTFLAKQANTPSTTNPVPGTPTYATNPVNPPWTGLTGGSGPFVWNGATVDTPRFRFGVTNNLVQVKPNGELFPKFTEATNRDCTFDFDTWRNDVTEFSDAKALTARAATYKLNTTGPVTATLTNAYAEKWTTSYSPTANAVQTESFNGVAQAIAVA